MKKGHILIVGGTKGAGRVAARAFAGEGHQVSVLARNLPGASKTPSKQTRFWKVDILDELAVRKTLAEIIKLRGAITALVFFQRYRGTGDSWSEELTTSLTATKRVIEILVDEFKLKNCAIVLISSINAALISQQLSVGYHVAKAGLNQIVRYYAVLLGRRGIRVNSVSPGTFLKKETEDYFLKNKPLVSLYKKMIPLGRMCRAEEVVQPILFLCGEQSSFVTGQNLVVDGGLTLTYQEALVRRLMESQRDPQG